MIPGEYIFKSEKITCNANQQGVVITVTNIGDRPIQVGSHFHFFEANRALAFDREKAFGKHLDILAGMSERFDPGASKEVTLVDIGGARKAFGANCLTEGELTDARKKDSLERAKKQQFNIK